MTDSDGAPRRSHAMKHVGPDGNWFRKGWLCQSMLGLALMMTLLFVPACGAAGANEEDGEQQQEQAEDEIPPPPGRP